MFGRRGRLPVASGPGVIVEFHEFAGRWYVTDRWGAGSGAAVEQPFRDADLGNAVLSRIKAARRRSRWVVTSPRDGEQWARFCARAADVSVSRYRPEKRLVVLADRAGMRCDDARHAPPRWEPLPDSADALGAALIARIRRLEPSWPTAASAQIAHDGATVLVYPRHGICSAGPIARLPAGAPAAAVGSQVLDALRASSTGGELQPDPASRAFRSALRQAGWTTGGLDAAAKVSIWRTTIGELLVSGVEPGVEIPVMGEGAEAVGSAVMAQLGPMAATSLIPQGRRPASFGPKTGWIAARGVSAAAVAEALGLREAHPASWDDGVEAAYSQGVFVGQLDNGWVLAAGADILTRQVDPAALSWRLRSPVQLFRTHRVPEYHEWSLAAGGAVIRAVRYCGDSGEYSQLGEPTEVEQSVRLDVPDVLITESHVFAVAGAWSLDPMTLHTYRSEHLSGTWGQLP